MTSVRNGWWALHQYQRWAILLWMALIVGITIRLCVTSAKKNTVLPIYLTAAQHWLEGQSLFLPSLEMDVYRYHPLFAVSFIPWTILPERLAGGMWRALGVGLFLLALWQLLREVSPRRLSPCRRGILFGLTLPLALQSLNNGQVNLHLISLLMFGMVACQRQQWNRAALFLAIPTLIKIYPIVVGLLISWLFPRLFLKRFLLFVGLGFLLPFACQDPQYVWGQYQEWITWLQYDDRRTGLADRTHRDLFAFCRTWFGIVERDWYVALQLSIGLGLAAFCKSMQRLEASSRILLMTVLHGTCLWMTVLGPSTESCTYSILAPTIGLLLVGGPLERPRWIWITLLSAYACLVIPVLAMMFPFGKQLDGYSPQPIGGLLLLFVLFWELSYRQFHPTTCRVYVPNSFAIRLHMLGITHPTKSRSDEPG